MKLFDIKNLLDCEILSCENSLDTEVPCCLSSDMMSDVLAHAKPGALLITGLISSQSIRTAEVSDSSGILYIRGKKPDASSITLANELQIPLLSTRKTMFETCWILHKAGLEEMY
jgi:predicted transcriptional regulator